MPTVVLLFISDFKAESSCRGSLPRFASYGVTIRTIGSYPAGSLHLLGRTEGFEPSTSESQSNVLPLHYVQHQSGAPPRIQTLIVGVEIRNAIRYTKGALNSSTSLFNSFPQISHPNVFSLANNSIFGISSPNSCTILFLISSGFLL